MPFDVHAGGPTDTVVGVGQLLRWESDTPDYRPLRKRFDDYIEGLVSDSRFLDVAGPRLVDAIDMLPAPARRDFLRAPQIVAQLIGWRRDGDALDVGALSEALLGELVAAGVVNALTIPVWAPRGDRYFDWRDGERVESATPWLQDARIAIDDKSPQMFPYDGTEEKLLLPLDDADSQRVNRELRLCVSTLERASPRAYGFTMSFLEQISTRLEPGAPNKFNSSSFSRYIGLALLVNPHIDRVELCNLTEAIVHESIHSMLFMIEELERPFLLERSSALIQVTSPWSGAVINLHAYVHACLVWYGLFWLWNGLVETGLYPQRRCESLRERSRRGFAHRPLSHIAEHRARLSDQVVEVMQRVETSMLAIAGERSLGGAA